MTASMGMKEVAIRRKRTRASSRTFHPLLNSLGQGKGGRRRSRSSSIKSAAFLFLSFPLPFTFRSSIHNILFFLLFVRKRPIDPDCSRLSEYDEKKMDHEEKSMPFWVSSRIHVEDEQGRIRYEEPTTEFFLDFPLIVYESTNSRW